MAGEEDSANGAAPVEAPAGSSGMTQKGNQWRSAPQRRMRPQKGPQRPGADASSARKKATSPGIAHADAPAIPTEAAGDAADAAERDLASKPQRETPRSPTRLRGETGRGTRASRRLTGEGEPRAG